MFRMSIQYICNSLVYRIFVTMPVARVKHNYDGFSAGGTIYLAAAAAHEETSRHIFHAGALSKCGTWQPDSC